MNCLFVYNPNSGNGKIFKHLDYIVQALKTKYEQVDIYETKSGKDAKKIASDACGKYDCLVFSGGDGTVNDIINGIGENENRPTIGYIPAGTVNDISRNLKISRNPRKAVKTIIKGKVLNHDIGKINDKYFMYVSAIGTFTGVSYTTEQHLKRKMGRLAYAINGLKEVVNPQVIRVIIQTKEETHKFQAPLVFVMNTKSIGGISINKYGHLNDGFFDIVIVKNGINKGLGNIIKLMLFGIRRKSLHKHFIFLKSDEFKVFVSDKVTWTIDGEAGPKGTVDIKNLHHHIQIFVPNDKL